jgi:hypothetical protein
LRRSDAAGEYLLYNRKARDLRLLFKTRFDLDGVPSRPMRSVAIDACDGVTLPSYLSLPHEDFCNGPRVMVIHSGPYARNVWVTTAFIYGSRTAANCFNELRRRGVSKFHAEVAAGSPTGFWRMSGHPAVQQALRNHYFDSIGLPQLHVSVQA